MRTTHATAIFTGSLGSASLGFINGGSYTITIEHKKGSNIKVTADLTKDATATGEYETVISFLENWNVLEIYRAQQSKLLKKL